MLNLLSPFDESWYFYKIKCQIKGLNEQWCMQSVIFVGLVGPILKKLTKYYKIWPFEFQWEPLSHLHSSHICQTNKCIFSVVSSSRQISESNPEVQRMFSTSPNPLHYCKYFFTKAEQRYRSLFRGWPTFSRWHLDVN